MIAGACFTVAGRLINGFMDSGLRADVKGFLRFLAHAFAWEMKAMGVVNEAVENGVSQGRIADGLMPVLDRELAGGACGVATLSIFEDFQQIASL